MMLTGVGDHALPVSSAEEIILYLEVRTICVNLLLLRTDLENRIAHKTSMIIDTLTEL